MAHLRNAIYDYESGTFQISGKNIATTHNTDQYCIIYVRVSSKKQLEEGDGLETQKATCISRAKSKGIIPFEIFTDEAISGSDMLRPGLEGAINFLEKENKQYPKIQYFVCSEISRIARANTLMEALEIEQRILATGCQIQTVTNSIDTSTDEGAMMKDIQYVFSSYERKKNAQRTKNNMRGRMLEGQYTFALPAGYCYEKESKELGKKSNSIVIKNEYAEIIGRGLKMYANGELLTKIDLYRYLKAANCKTNAQYLKPKQLHKQFVDRLLDPIRLFFYAGYIVYPKRGINEPIKATHQAIITLEQAKRIIYMQQNKNSEKGKTIRKDISKDISKDMPLRGILICGECGKKLTGGRSKGKLGKKYLYYFCQNKDCSERLNIPGDKIHEEFRNLLTLVTPTEGIIKIYELLFREILTNKLGVQSELVIQKEKEIQRMEKEAASIEEKILTIESPLLLQNFEKKYTQLQNQITESRFKIEEIERKKNGYNENIEPFIEILKNPLKIRSIDHPELKKLLISCLFGGSISYNKKTGYGTQQIPLYNWYMYTLKNNDNPMGRSTGLEPAILGTTNRCFTD